MQVATQPAAIWALAGIRRKILELLPHASTAVLHDGKTALQILGDQLDLLDVEVDEIGDAVRHQDSERLLIHGRFLEATFGRKPNELSLPRSE